MSQFFVLFLAAGVVAHLLARAWRSKATRHTDHVLATFPKNDEDDHAPGDGARKGAIIRDHEMGILISWVLEVVIPAWIALVGQSYLPW